MSDLREMLDKAMALLQDNWTIYDDNPPSTQCIHCGWVLWKHSAGVIRHIRVDHPTAPTVTRFYVDPVGAWTGPTVRPYGCTCPSPHVEIDPKHVTSVG